MITSKTQAAIAVLNHIYAGKSDACPERCVLTDEKKRTLLSQLSSAGLIILKANENPASIQSYTLAHRPGEISLLNILEAIGEHLNCNSPVTEEFYMRYGKVAQKLGVVNRITRIYLKEITLSDL